MNFQQQGQNAPYQNPFQQQAPQQQQQQAPQQQAPQQQAPESNGVAKLAEFKQMLDQGLITQEDYDAAKRRALGLE